MKKFIYSFELSKDLEGWANFGEQRNACGSMKWLRSSFEARFVWSRIARLRNSERFAKGPLMTHRNTSKAYFRFLLAITVYSGPRMREFSPS